MMIARFAPNAICTKNRPLQGECNQNYTIIVRIGLPIDHIDLILDVESNKSGLGMI